MKTVIATCCPYSNLEKSNLEKVLLILQQAGLVESDASARWHDKAFGVSDTIDPLGLDHHLLQALIIEEDTTIVFPEVPNVPSLPADSRCLWLLEFWAEKLPEAKFLLFYNRAESALAHACRKGIEPQEAVNSWLTANRQLLKFQRGHRRQAVLFDMEAAIRQPNKFLDACSPVGLTLQSLPEISDFVPDQNTLELYLARLLLENQPEVQALQIELEASAQPLEDVSPIEVLPLELFNEQSRRLVQQRKLHEDLDAISEKLEVADYTVKNQDAEKQRLQVQIDQLTQDHDKQVKLSADQKAELEKVQLAHQKLEKTSKEVAQENELLLLQLHQVQEELEKTFLQKQQQEEQTQKDKVTQKQIQDKIDQLTKSHDKQLKSIADQKTQLEAVQQANQKQESTTKEVTQENELLLLQLHQVQEELEKTFLQKQQQEEQIQKDQITQKQLQDQIDQHTKSHDKQLKLITEQNTQLEAVQQVNQKQESTTKEIIQEKELLLLQLHQVQEELEKAFLQKQQQEEQIQKDQITQKQLQDQIDQHTKSHDKQLKLNTDQKTQLEAVQQANQKQESTTKEVIQENEFLLLQLHQVQEELEKIFLQKQQMEKQTQQLLDKVENEKLHLQQQANTDLLSIKSEVKKLQQHEANLKQTVSWKLTTPIRAFGKPFRKLSKDKLKIEQQIKLLKTCGLFDEAWYNATNGDVVKDGYDPVEHYVRHGATEGRDPSPKFSTRRYLEINPDVAEAGMNPLVHYAKFGLAEKRCIDTDELTEKLYLPQ
jgi:hypothetical protein